MKGFINKRDKIKWEDTPFQPEFTGEKLAEMVSGELSLDDLADVVYLSDPPEDGRILMYQENRWVPSTVYLNNIDDVSITTPQTGQILQYDLNGYAWKNVTPPSWELFETKTADGSDRFLTSSEFPEGVIGVMINITMTAGPSALAVGVGYSFDGSSYPKTSAIANGINTGIRYSRSWYIKDANMWFNKNTTASTGQGLSNLSENIDAFNIGGFLKRIRCYAPQDSVVPEGSTMEIYIKH